MIKSYLLRLRTLVVFGILLAPGIVSAQTLMPAGSTSSSNFGLVDKFRGASVPGLINGIIQFALGVAGFYFLLLFIYGGFLWMTSSGSSDQTKKAKKHLTSSVIGLAIIFFAYMIVGAVIGIIGRTIKGA